MRSRVRRSEIRTAGPVVAATATQRTQRTRRDAGPLTDKGHARRGDLLLAAREVFERVGYGEARVADIVDQAHVAQGTFYTYFDSKEVIFQEVAQGVIDSMLVTLHGDSAVGTPPFERIRAATRRFIQAYRPNARIIALIEQVGTFTPEMRALRLALREAFVDRSARGIARQQVAGEADPGIDPRLSAEVLGAMVDHTCYVWLTLGQHFDEEALVHVLSSVWARAIGVAEPAADRSAKRPAPSRPANAGRR